jgi:hypothetical protein
MKKLKASSLLYVVICLIAGMWYGVRVGLTVALLFIGVHEVINAIVLYKGQRRKSAIVPFCIGVILCGFVAIEIFEAIVDVF